LLFTLKGLTEAVSIAHELAYTVFNRPVMVVLIEQRIVRLE